MPDNGSSFASRRMVVLQKLQEFIRQKCKELEFTIDFAKCDPASDTDSQNAGNDLE
jgi:hypothetical protein